MSANGQATPIYQERDFYVPTFEIIIRNRKLEKEVINDVISLTYKDSLANIDSFEITINNWDARLRTFKYIEGDRKKIFFPGQDIEVWMGYIQRGEKKLFRMLYGEITSLEPQFPGSGAPTLNVRGLNILHRLRDKQRSDVYLNKRDSQIASEIARRIGIGIELRPNYMTAETKNVYLPQQNQYDIVFLLERARTIGYELTINPEDKKLVFKPSNFGSQKHLLEWGRSLLSFRPTLTTANQVSEVVVTGWNPQTKSRVVGRAKRRDLETRALGVEKDIRVIEQSLTQKVEVVADRPVSNQSEANSLALEILEKMAKGMVKASGATPGVPELRTGTYVEIRELGELFSGRYFVTESSHTIGDSGYTTSFSARMEEKA